MVVGTNFGVESAGTWSVIAPDDMEESKEVGVSNLVFKHESCSLIDVRDASWILEALWCVIEIDCGFSKS